MRRSGCTTRVVVCDDAGVSGGLDVLPFVPPVLALLALIADLLVRRSLRRRRHAPRPTPRRVWVSVDGDVVDGPA